MDQTNQPSKNGFKGFIPVSREAYKLLNRKYGKQLASETEAYCILMANVNYRERNLVIFGKTVTCPPGDSYKSLGTWMRLFRWSKTRVRRFFLSLKKLGLIDYTSENNLTHIHIVNYAAGQKSKEGNDEHFNLFWESYHEITQLPKRSVAKARSEWNKLSAEERNLAISQIPYYYEGLNNTKYCKYAAGYLENKSFLDE